MDFRESPLLRRLVFSGGLRFLGMIAVTIAGLFLSPYMMDKLGKNDCGLMVFVGTVVAMIGLLDGGLNAALSRHVAAALGKQDEKEFDRYFNSGFFLFLGAGAAVFLIALCIAINMDHIVRWNPWFSEHVAGSVQASPEPDVRPQGEGKTISVRESDVPVPIVEPGLFSQPGALSLKYRDAAEIVSTPERNIALARILLVIVAFQLGVEFLLRSLVGVVSGALRTDIVSAMTLGVKILRPALSFAVLYFGGGVVVLTTAGCCVTLFLVPTWFYLAGRVVPRLHVSWRLVDFEAVKTLYRFSFFAFVSFFSRNLHTSIAVLVLSSTHGLETQAIYTMIAATLYTYGNDVILMMINFLSPVFAQLGARKELETMRKILFFTIKVSTGAAVFVAFGLIAWGHPFIERWMCSEDPTRIAAYVPLTFLAWIIVLEQSQAPMIEYLYGTANHRYYALVNIIEAGVAIALFFPFVPRYGMIGVAVSLLAAAVLARVVLQPIFVCKVLEVRLVEYYGRFIALMSTAALCLVLPAVATRMLVAADYPRLFLVGGLSVALFGPAYVFAVFNRNEREIVWNAVFKRRSSKT